MGEEASANLAAIRSFLASQIASDEFDDDTDIFEVGLVTSLFAMELVTFVEGRFAITVASDDLDLENFVSVNRLAAFVTHKRIGA